MDRDAFNAALSVSARLAVDYTRGELVFRWAAGGDDRHFRRCRGEDEALITLAVSLRATGLNARMIAAWTIGGSGPPARAARGRWLSLHRVFPAERTEGVRAVGRVLGQPSLVRPPSS